VRIGVISDTHGLVRPAALDALAGCERILHAGDIGGPEVLAMIGRVAPVVAVRGNNDREPWAADLPETTIVELGATRVLMIHDAKQLGAVPAGVACVVAGHSHKPVCETRGGVLWLNPGSAGPRRFKLPVSVAILMIAGGSVRGELVVLEG
jgi:uncharacterized protein